MADLSKLLKNQEQLDRLAGKMMEEFRQVEKDRRLKEMEWEENLRQVKGIYDPEILQRIEEDSSKVYPRYTRSKEVPAIAKLNNILLPSYGENWDIDSTPKPQVSEDELKQVSVTLANRVKQDPKYRPTEEDIDEEIRNIVANKKDRMKETIQDQLINMNYRQVIKKVIKSGIRYGTGIWKGPLSQKYNNKRYSYSNGEISQKNEEKYIPKCTYVPIWRWYPDMSTSEVSETSFIFQHHCVTLPEMYQLFDRDDFDKDVLKEVMKEHPNGDYTLKNWEQALLNISSTEDGVNKSKDKTSGAGGVVRGFEMLERWGLVDGLYLKYAGIENAEDLEDDKKYETVSWIVGGRMVKIVLSPLKDITTDERPFNTFYYEKDESSIFGEGLPRTIRGTAITIGAASRMILDNAAAVAGPQIEANTDLLDENQDLTTIHPRKVWFRGGSGVEAQYPALRQLSFDSHITEYQSIIEMFKRFGDEESALPSFLFAEPSKTNTETATGMDTRQDNMNVTLDDIVKNFDEPNEEFIKGMYSWNMEFNEDESIKGDFEVKALGSSSILNKQTRNMMLTQFASTLTEEERLYLNTPYYLEQRAKLMDLNVKELLLSEKEVQSKMQEKRDIEAEKLAKAEKQADIEYRKAQAAYNIARAKSESEDAKKTNIEVQKEIAGEDTEEDY